MVSEKEYKKFEPSATLVEIVLDIIPVMPSTVFL